jgi:PAS domain S-box-containing protein
MESSSKSQPPAQDHKLGKTLAAALPTGFMIIVFEVLNALGFGLPLPGILLLGPVGYASFVAGAGAGLAAALIAVSYELFLFAEPGNFLVYSPANTIRLITGALGTPLAALAVAVGRKYVLSTAYRLANREAEKKAEELVEHERFQLTTILEQLPSGVVIVNDPSCKIAYANLEATKLLGHDVTEFHPFAYHRMFHAGGQPYTPDEWPLIRSLKNGDIVDDEEFLYARPGGHLQPMRAHCAPVRDAQGKITAAAMVFYDVTEKRRAQVAQLELAAIVDTSEDAIFSVSLDGIVLSWNPAAARIFGYTADEVRGQSLPQIMQGGLSDDIVSLLEQIRRGENVASFDTVCVSKDGGRKPVSMRLSPILDLAGHAQAAMMVVREHAAAWHAA